jgi:protein TonB
VEEEPAKKKAGPLLVILLLMALIVIGIAGYYFYTRGQRIQAPSRQTTMAGPGEVSYKEKVAEQNFLVTNTSDQAPVVKPDSVARETAQKEPEPSQPVGQRRSRQEPPSQKRTQEESRREKTVESEKPQQQAPPQTQPVAGGTPAEQRQPEPPPTTPTEQTQQQPDAQVIEQQAQVVTFKTPSFSDIARSKGLSGKLLVRVQVGPDGKPLQATIVSSSNEYLDDAVIKAAMQSEFTPARTAAGPVTSWLTIPLNFREQ